MPIDHQERSFKHEVKKRSKYHQLFVDIFAGTVAGINVTLVGHPFDTLKVRLQTQPIKNPIYSGVVDCFKKTVQWEGLGGLYKGVSSPLVGQMFFRACLFLSYGQAKIYLSDNGQKKLSYIDYFKAGAIAWVFATIAECPIDFFKTQMQIQIIKSKTIEGFVPEYANMKDCFSKIIKLNGPAGAYQGILPHFMRNIPAGATHLGMFEVARLKFADKLKVEVKDLPIKYTVISGAIGGWSYWFFFYPLDLAKSAIQSDHPDKSKRRFKGIVDVYQQLYTHEGGIKRFYKGFTPCLMRSIPANAALLLTSSYLSEHL